jgi:hypothetical protein
MSWDIIETIMEGKAAAATDAEPELTGKSYRPGSGTEGCAFDDAWCSHCARDAEYRSGGEDADPDLGCKILADALGFEMDHPRYPKEWVYGHDGRPRCTAFTTDPTCPLRCDRTPDMFASPGQET